ncbi:MAG: TPM domain-containing protein [Pseudomonadota bacterium]
MNIKRLWRHLAASPWRVKRALPRSAMQAIERAIRDSERTHRGQICFAIEGALDLGPLLRGRTARQRAIEIFSRLRVWDTEHNNGVLIYLLLADHDVEIVADRGIHVHVGREGWEKICRQMESAFRAGRFEDGVLAGVRAAGDLLARHYPGSGANEIPDKPVRL